MIHSLMNQFKKLFRFAAQELKAQRQIQLFLIFNLSIGIFGFLILQTFQQSLAEQTRAKAQDTLSADLSISARRVITETEIKNFESQFQFVQKTQTKNFFAMATNGTKTKLVQIVAFDRGFPLYGDYEFLNKNQFSQKKMIWIDTDIPLQLGFDPQNVQSQKIKIGQANFEIADIVVKDPTRTFKPGGFASVIYMPSSSLAETQLIQEGSTFSQNILYKTNSENIASAAQKKLSQKVNDTTLKFETALQDASNSNQVLKYFSDYLGLVSLVALGLCFLCGGYLLRWVFLEQKKNIAIYKTLGLQNAELILIQIIRNTVISIVAFGISFVLVIILIPSLQNVLIRFNLPIILALQLKSSIFALLISLFVPQIISFPLLLEILSLSPNQLFHGEVALKSKNTILWVWLLASAMFFWGLTVYQSQSIKTGSVFTIGLIALYFIFKFVLSIFLQLFEKLLSFFSWINRYALLGIIRRQKSTDLVFITMSLAILVLSLLPHIKVSIINELKPSSTSNIPQLFMFDIQKDQKAILFNLAEQKVNKKIQFTPLVRSRILKINDQNYERFDASSNYATREQDEEARFRNRGVNLTYKKNLQDSEEVVEGQWSSSVYNQNANSKLLPEISLEKKYAEKIDAHVNDVMTFDVQGLEVKARIASIRQVRWTSFEPNFFIVFQDGVLNDAPQVFLSSISNLSLEQINTFQSEAVAALPNVSLINVQQTVQSSLIFIDQMALALQVMAYLSMFVGLFIFIVLLNTQIRERISEMNLLQILGLSNNDVIKIVQRQFLFLVTLALLSGLSLSLISAWLMMRYIFNLSVSFDFYSMLFIGVIIFPISYLAVYFGLRPLKQLSPIELIRST